MLPCLFNDGGFDGETTVIIDDRELSLREFGGLLRPYAGWGMRISFVPEDEINEEPCVEVREPEGDQSGVQMRLVPPADRGYLCHRVLLFFTATRRTS